MHKITPEQFERALAKRGQQPPPHVTALKEKWKSAQRVAELAASMTGAVDDGVAESIVALRLEYEAALEAWLVE